MIRLSEHGGHLLWEFDPDQEWLEGSEHFARILDNARAALGLYHVALNLYDPHLQSYRTVLSLMSNTPGTRLMEYITRRPRTRPEETYWRHGLSGAVPVQVNPHLMRVYLGGETVRTTLNRYARGVVPSGVLWLAAVVMGQGHIVTVPLKTRQIEAGRIMGALSFMQRRPFTGRQMRAAEAFAHLAALSLENALLAKTLAAQVRDLELTRAQVGQAEERLRREVAEMLHSRVQTRLLVAWHRLGTLEEALPGGHYRALLDEVRRDLDEVREHEVREASHALHPSVISLGLLPAVRSLLGHWGGGVRLELQADPVLENLDLPEAFRLLVYRTLEEALGNALRHAHAGRIAVRLAHTATGLRLEVEDDGVGFALDGLPAGLGFGLIESRVGVAGGSWGLSSAPGQGTRFWAEFPLRPPGVREASLDSPSGSREGKDPRSAQRLR